MTTTEHKQVSEALCHDTNTVVVVLLLYGCGSWARAPHRSASFGSNSVGEVT